MARDRTLLTPEELATFLQKHPTWTRSGEVLTRTLERPSFADAIALVDRVARAADAADHHPDIDIRYRKVTLALSTHDAGGLTWRDTKLAAEIDSLAG